ncbi:MAG: hypothetical protein BWX88_01108 [Planctomycetes bacterium ADurb.Bin126]|nr:MAG: hypothetical protein BWX88_01108 [Planctomycetes bacterium ADurb.Bin126]HOD80407.1 hypothetical protein [Phycisphaerae bacterium]HQL72720.1 hypothetical protein [Phycisphaerae bacterium]
MPLTESDSQSLRLRIQADPQLADHARLGRDADILTELSRVRDDIQVPRGRVDAVEFDALIDPTERMDLSTQQLQHLSVLLIAGQVDMQGDSAAVFADIVLADKPSSRARINANKTRPGSVAERDFPGLTVNDISNALKPDRPDGRIAKS